VVRPADMCVLAAAADGTGVLLDGRPGSTVPPRDVKLDRGASITALALAGARQELLVSAAGTTLRLWELGRLDAVAGGGSA